MIAPEPSPLPNSSVFRRLLRRSIQAMAWALGVPVAVLLGLVLYLMEVSHQVEKTDQVRVHARTIEMQLLHMQTSFRGYRLSGEEAHLDGYLTGDGPSGVMDALKELKRQVANNPTQTAQVQEIRTRVMAWIQFVRSELDLVRADPPQRPRPDFLRVGSPLFDTARSALQKLIVEETRLRAARSATHDRMVLGVLSGFLMAMLAGIPALTWWLVKLLRTVNESYEQSLRATAAHAEELRVTLSSIGDAVVATDASGRVEFINPVAEAMIGWTQEEAKGRPLLEVFEIFQGPDRLPAANPVEQVLKENGPAGPGGQNLLRSRDGREILIEDSAAPIRGKDGQVKGVILVFRDVTEKHRAERKLKESESRLSFLNHFGDAIRGLPDADEIIRTTVEHLGRFLQVSRCGYATVNPATNGFSILQDYASDCRSAVGDYQITRFGRIAENCVRAGRTLVIRNVHEELADDQGLAGFDEMGVGAMICCPLSRDGHLRAMIAVEQTTPRDWSAAEISLVETVVERCWTVLERKQAESDMKKASARAETAALAAADAAERFRLLGDVISLQVWTATPEGRLDYVNEQCLKFFGIEDESQVLGSGWGSYVHPDDFSVAMDQWMHSVRTGRRYAVEYRLRSAQHGEYRWFLVRAEPMRDKQGKIVKWFGTNTAIHKLKVAQSEAERASRAKDEFLAALSHELRTPLTPVLITAAALRDDARLPRDIRDQMAMMERNIALEARLIDDLLDLTAISRGKLKLRPEPCDAHSLISLALEIVRNDAQSKGLKLEQDFGAPLSGLVADPARFQQVFWNLLRNAVKFTPPGGRISIQTHDEQDENGRHWFCVSVTDTGIGIDPKSLEDIFQPFEQGNAAGDHRFGGVGLGLAIARAIVGLHGGRIQAFSEGRKHGARFVVKFPGAMPPPSGVMESTGQAPAAPAGSAETRRLRLLLVEDHAATLEALSALLVRAGHSVVTASSVRDALAAAGEGVFDLVISDLGLPDGSGIQLMEQLRSRKWPGIALSGYGMEEDVVRCQEAGFLAHLVKPVRFGDLQRTIESVMNNVENPSANPPS